MMQVQATLVGVGIALYATGLLWTVINALLMVGFAVVGLYCGVALGLNSSKKYCPSTKLLLEQPTMSLFKEMSVSCYCV